MKKGITWRRLSSARKKTVLPGTAEMLKDEERQALNEMQRLHFERKKRPSRNELVRRGIAVLSPEGKLRARKLTKAEIDKTIKIFEQLTELQEKSRLHFYGCELFPKRFKNVDSTQEKWAEAARNDFLFAFGKKAPIEAQRWLELWKNAKNRYELVAKIAEERGLKIMSNDIAHIAAKMAKEGKSPEYVEKVARNCGKEFYEVTRAFGIYQ